MKSYRAPASFQKGRYVPNKVLGTGTYGQVIRCHDTKTGTDVAVKVAQSDAAYRRSALNEISALLCLKENSDSVGIIDSFEDAGHVCIVSELLDRNLFEVLRSRGFGPLAMGEVREVAAHVLSALAALHNSGFIHCDIKPENIMLRCCEPASATTSPYFDACGSDSFNSTDSSNRSRDQPNHQQHHHIGSLAPGQEVMASANANYNNQLWRHTASIDSMSCNSRTGGFLDSELNFGFSPRYGGKAATTKGGVARDNSSLDAFFSGSSTSFGLSYATRNDTLVDHNSPTSSEEATERSPREVTLPSPYSQTCLIDFGAVRRFNENSYYDVQSLWYRAPEVLCGLPYTTAIDSWSVGCVLFELFTGKPFFPGESPQQQLSLIVQHVGYPSQTALSMGCLAAQYHLPMVYGSPDARREHVRQWMQSCREAGLQRWRKHQLQKQQQDTFKPTRGTTRRHTTDSGSSMEEDDVVANGNPFDESDVDGTSKERELLIDLICELLNPDEKQRLSCTRAMQHPFIRGSTPAPCPTLVRSPYTATPVAAMAPGSAVPQQQPMPCVVTSVPVAHPVLMTGSPVSPFVLHPVHSSAGSSVPLGVAAPADAMPTGVDMSGAPMGLPPMPHPAQQQPHAGFTAYPNAPGVASMYGAPSHVVSHPMQMFTPMNNGPACVPVAVSGHNTSVYNSPASNGSVGQPQSAMSFSPSFTSPTAYSQSHGPMGYSPVALSGTTSASGATPVQALGAPTYVLASANAGHYVADHYQDSSPNGMSPYMLCHFQQHAAYGTVMSP